MSDPRPVSGPPVEAGSCGCTDACGCACGTATTSPSGVEAPEWRRDAAWARRLAWVSLVWMAGEGALGLTAGVAAGSVALTGWALGSVIEGLASGIVIWRFTGRRLHSPSAERSAGRAVGVSFWLLAGYIAVQAGLDLANRHHPSATALGMAVTAASLLAMPALGAAKHRLGARLDSRATAGEGTQNYLCAAQAAAVLAALAIVAADPALWWVDAAAGLLIAGWSVREGRASWRGEDCC